MAFWFVPLAFKAFGVVCGGKALLKLKRGYEKNKEAKEKVKEAHERHEKNVVRYQAFENQATKTMDRMGELELNIISSFKDFSDIMERIQNRPDFEKIVGNRIDLPDLTVNKLKDVSMGALALLGGVGGVAAGTFAGFAASGCAYAATYAFAAAGTGTAISSLGGAAAANATLAWLGGGTLAAEGGGVALGSTVLGFATVGIGLLVGSYLFESSADSEVERADSIYSDMLRIENKIVNICSYLDELCKQGVLYTDALERLNMNYQLLLKKVGKIIETPSHKVDFTKLKNEEQKMIENLTLYVGLLYRMCSVQFVLKSKNEEEINKVNTKDIDENVKKAKTVFPEVFSNDGSSYKEDFIASYTEIYKTMSAEALFTEGQAYAYGGTHVKDMQKAAEYYYLADRKSLEYTGYHHKQAQHSLEILEHKYSIKPLCRTFM